MATTTKTYAPRLKVEYETEIRPRLKEELDYRHEARNMALYRHMLARDVEVHVPDVLEDLSTRRLLTMTWLEGKPIKEIAETASQKIRDQIADYKKQNSIS